MTAAGEGRPLRGPSALSREQLGETRACAARLCAIPTPLVYLTDLRELEALIARLGTLITSAGGRALRVSTSPEGDWVREPATLTHRELGEIRKLATQLRDSPALAPAETARIDAIIARTDAAIQLRRERELYWAGKGEPMPAFLTHQPPPKAGPASRPA